MKKSFIAFVALFVLVLASCTKEEIRTVTNDEVTPTWQEPSSMIIQNEGTHTGTSVDEEDGDSGIDITDPNEEPEKEGA